MNVNSFNQNPFVPSWPRVFYFGNFLSFALIEFRCTSASELSLSPSDSFFFFFFCVCVYVIYPFGLSVIFSVPISGPKKYCFLCIWLLICFYVFSTGLLVELTFDILEVSVLLVLLRSVPVSFESPFFHYYYYCCYCCYSAPLCLIQLIIPPDTMVLLL